MHLGSCVPDIPALISCLRCKQAAGFREIPLARIDRRCRCIMNLNRWAGLLGLVCSSKAQCLQRYQARHGKPTSKIFLYRLRLKGARFVCVDSRHTCSSRIRMERLLRTKRGEIIEGEIWWSHDLQRVLSRFYLDRPIMWVFFLVRRARFSTMEN